MGHPSGEGASREGYEAEKHAVEGHAMGDGEIN